MQRASDGWWESSHPTMLCGKLSPPHCELIGLWECKDEAEEKALHEQFNEGVLKRKDCHNEAQDRPGALHVVHAPPPTRRRVPPGGAREDAEGMLRRPHLLVQALQDDV